LRTGTRTRTGSVPALPSRGGTGAFTLLEMVVASAIFMAVIGGAYALFDGSRRLAARAEFRTGMLQTARAAIRAVENDLRGALMSGTAYDTGFLGTSEGSEKEPLDRLELVSIASPSAEVSNDLYKDATKPRRSDLSRVAYWIERDETKKAHGLVRERLGAMLPPETRQRREEDVEAVAADVTGLNLRYWDGAQWQESWNSRQLRKLPRAIEVTVRVRGVWKDVEEFESHTSRVYLPVAAELPEARQP
jgi:type II secretion system protein J